MLPAHLAGGPPSPVRRGGNTKGIGRSSGAGARLEVSPVLLRVAQRVMIGAWGT
jgi:hypothetical protein